VNAAFQRGAMADEMESPPGSLAFTPHIWSGEPDRRHQITPAQLGEHPRIDLVRLACQRRQARL
jgi:hypothetical protein